MEQQSNISWILVGIKSNESVEISEDILQKMTLEAFIEGKTYKLFLCGEVIEKTGTLIDMEDGYQLIKTQLEDYSPGDYCIISSHTEGDLLFMPTEEIITND